MEINKIYNEDCLEGMKRIADGSIDLIIADPPYYKTINEDWDKQWKTEGEYMEWCKLWISEVIRIMKDNGSLYLYGNIDILSKQKVLILDKYLYFRQVICLNKGIKSIAGRTSRKLRMFPTASEYCMFFVKQNKDADINNDMCFMALRKYFIKAMDSAGLSRTAVNKLLGHRRAEHTFYTKGQWLLPTKDVYSELQSIMELPLTYAEVVSEYNKSRFTFNLPIGVTDVWDFNPDKIKYGHPTQKPQDITERIIMASSNKDNLVLVPFVGSGSECVACMNTGRNFIGFEMDKGYYDIACKRIEEHKETKDIKA